MCIEVVFGFPDQPECGHELRIGVMWMRCDNPHPGCVDWWLTSEEGKCPGCYSGEIKRLTAELRIETTRYEFALYDVLSKALTDADGFKVALEASKEAEAAMKRCQENLEIASKELTERMDHISYMAARYRAKYPS